MSLAAYRLMLVAYHLVFIAYSLSLLAFCLPPSHFALDTHAISTFAVAETWTNHSSFGPRNRKSTCTMSTYMTPLHRTEEI
ncbi:hypothetical protein Hanom_Chr08g00730451 [Helianthus anomalus]